MVPRLLHEKRDQDPWSKIQLLSSRKGTAMLYYALVFLIIAMLAGFLGFGGVEFAAAEIARILFFLFLVLFILGMVAHLARRGV
jgi:uncharacterized membrane protein YtjA (UPF0391 family)